MPTNKVIYYNRIDMGIFLLFIDLCLKHDNIKYARTLLTDKNDDDEEKTLLATYQLNQRKGEILLWTKLLKI